MSVQRSLGRTHLLHPRNDLLGRLRPEAATCLEAVIKLPPLPRTFPNGARRDPKGRCLSFDFLYEFCSVHIGTIM